MIKTDARPVVITTANTSELDPREAAEELVATLGTDAALYMLFVRSDYPRAELAAELAARWGERLAGCTSAGNIGPTGFDESPVLAVAFAGADLRVETVVLEPLSDLPRAIAKVRPHLERISRDTEGVDGFGVLLVDGLSLLEEHVAAALKPFLGERPLIGGSAGDDLTFTRTEVLYDGEFQADRATLTVVATNAPFKVFRLHHYEPGETILVITSATPETRTVHEINGVPAAQAFAEAIQVPIEDLTPEHFSAHPVVLRLAGENWVRSISGVLPDGSLTFLAANETGAALKLARPNDPVSTLRNHLSGLRDELGGISGIFASDCILRRIEFRRSGLTDTIGEVMIEFGVTGFSTYGEQFEDFHMNQTMVGIAFGAGAAGAAGAGDS